MTSLEFYKKRDIGSHNLEGVYVGINAKGFCTWSKVI